ncbi:MAG TPA: class I SAM-dependent methyltransferase [Chloroflexota bacterium]|nr:class I SAM-dependent methyltransferase [Chloroflexota bacterium]
MSEQVTCRACGASELRPVLSLGRTPLANACITAEELDQPEPTYPLDVVFCPACTLVQITETVPPEKLFGNYLYFSSFSDTMLAHARALTSELIAARALGAGSLAVEIASNDGYLLRNYLEAGIAVLGIEPARNIAAVAQQRGVRTMCEFFNADLARRLRHEGYQADVLHAHNVLAHVADLHGVVAGIAELLKADGVAIIEAPYVKDLLDKVEFDTVYHEHLCYFSLTALTHLFARHGLTIVDAARIPIHGGSLRVTAGRESRPSRAVAALLAEEAGWGVDQPAVYLKFARQVEALRDQITSTLRRLKAEGTTIAAYGASAKGATLLSYCGIGRETLDFVVDRSTAKQGRYTPGTHLPILAPEELLKAMPDYTLLLTWNFADEILAQQQAYRDAGGRFIIPIPSVEIV